MPSMGFVQQLGIGALTTIQVAVCAYLLALAIGTLFALATLRPRLLTQLIWVPYASVFTGVPSLLVAFLFYYGGSDIVASLLAPFGIATSIEVTPFMAAVAALGMVYGAYLADLIRSAIQNVPHGQFEAGRVLLVPRRIIWLRVILPQMLRLALPGMTNMWIVVLKDTALVSLIGLKEIMAYAKLASGVTKEPFIYYLLASAFFLGMTWLTYYVARNVEQWAGRGFHPIVTKGASHVL
ncbi:MULTISPECIES: ABC transporter permease [unclassified Achromobacter]|uniref:ABC transporter permease n=1 Tax=unclassified Achromobacter TaxID=2626865 RepID=UPI000B514C66|nr:MULTISPECIES: ABC transporter permease subunit [unclassified Achromobacter]OWT74483.1 amino acid ABC transporter permease [Achromobacter sp. HZ34]OWT78950.1 amino acid ABC transporter permease [Achromobacter sp. HZ28]